MQLFAMIKFCKEKAWKEKINEDLFIEYLYSYILIKAKSWINIFK